MKAYVAEALLGHPPRVLEAKVDGCPWFARQPAFEVICLEYKPGNKGAGVRL